MRRWLVPAVLSALIVGSAVAAVRAPSPPVPSPASEDVPPATAVLSPRRVPEVLATFVADARLAARLHATITDPQFGRASSWCLVVEQSSRPVFDHEADARLIPASNMKLVTAVAALQRLGPETRIDTRVVADAPHASGVVEGPLWLVGAGDPLLATTDYASSLVNPLPPGQYTPFEQLADRVVAAGVREIRGGVVGDETRYDNQRFIPSWRRTYITGGHVSPLSALLVNDGFVQFRPARVHTSEPAVHAATVLTELLQARGVVIAAAPSVGRAGGRHEVAKVTSPPVAEIVGQMLRESDNVTAELLVKELGHRFGGGGSTEAGLEVLRATLAAAGLPADHLEAVDGSGLDRSDRASCALIMSALTAAGGEDELAEGLAIAGRTGTLARRFNGHVAEGRLRAKTGFLDGVVALSGYLEPSRGDQMAFAFLANGLPVPTEPPGYRLQERVAEVLARYPESPPPEELAPR